MLALFVIAFLSSSLFADQSANLGPLAAYENYLALKPQLTESQAYSSEFLVRESMWLDSYLQLYQSKKDVCYLVRAVHSANQLTKIWMNPKNFRSSGWTTSITSQEKIKKLNSSKMFARIPILEFQADEPYHLLARIERITTDPFPSRGGRILIKIGKKLMGQIAFTETDLIQSINRNVAYDFRVKKSEIPANQSDVKFLLVDDNLNPTFKFNQLSVKLIAPHLLHDSEILYSIAKLNRVLRSIKFPIQFERENCELKGLMTFEPKITKLNAAQVTELLKLQILQLDHQSQWIWKVLQSWEAHYQNGIYRMISSIEAESLGNRRGYEVGTSLPYNMNFAVGRVLAEIYQTEHQTGGAHLEQIRNRIRSLYSLFLKPKCTNAHLPMIPNWCYAEMSSGRKAKLEGNGHANLDLSFVSPVIQLDLGEAPELDLLRLFENMLLVTKGDGITNFVDGSETIGNDKSLEPGKYQYELWGWAGLSFLSHNNSMCKRIQSMFFDHRNIPKAALTSAYQKDKVGTALLMAKLVNQCRV